MTYTYSPPFINTQPENNGLSSGWYYERFARTSAGVYYSIASSYNTETSELVTLDLGNRTLLSRATVLPDFNAGIVAIPIDNATNPGAVYRSLIDDTVYVGTFNPTTGAPISTQATTIVPNRIQDAIQMSGGPVVVFYEDASNDNFKTFINTTTGVKLACPDTRLSMSSQEAYRSRMIRIPNHDNTGELLVAVARRDVADGSVAGAWAFVTNASMSMIDSKAVATNAYVSAIDENYLSAFLHSIVYNPTTKEFYVFLHVRTLPNLGILPAVRKMTLNSDNTLTLGNFTMLPQVGSYIDGTYTKLAAYMGYDNSNIFLSTVDDFKTRIYRLSASDFSAQENFLVDTAEPNTGIYIEDFVVFDNDTTIAVFPGRFYDPATDYTIINSPVAFYGPLATPPAQLGSRSRLIWFG